MLINCMVENPSMQARFSFKLIRSTWLFFKNKITISLILTQDRNYPKAKHKTLTRMVTINEGSSFLFKLIIYLPDSDARINTKYDVTKKDILYNSINFFFFKLLIKCFKCQKSCNSIGCHFLVFSKKTFKI